MVRRDRDLDALAAGGVVPASAIDADTDASPGMRQDRKSNDGRRAPWLFLYDGRHGPG